MTDQQAESRDIDAIHEFTDFDQFATVAEASALMGLDFDIATEIRKDGRYWMVIVH